MTTTYKEWTKQAVESKDYPVFVNKDIRISKLEIELENVAERETAYTTEIDRLKAIIAVDDARIVNLLDKVAKLKASTPAGYKKRICFNKAKKEKLLMSARASKYATADTATRAKIIKYHMNETGATEKAITKILEELR